MCHTAGRQEKGTNLPLLVIRPPSVYSPGSPADGKVLSKMKMVSISINAIKITATPQRPMSYEILSSSQLAIIITLLFVHLTPKL